MSPWGNDRNFSQTQKEPEAMQKFITLALVAIVTFASTVHADDVKIVKDALENARADLLKAKMVLAAAKITDSDKKTKLETSKEATALAETNLAEAKGRRAEAKILLDATGSTEADIAALVAKKDAAYQDAVTKKLAAHQAYIVDFRAARALGNANPLTAPQKAAWDKSKITDDAFEAAKVVEQTAKKQLDEARVLQKTVLSCEKVHKEKMGEENKCIIELNLRKSQQVMAQADANRAASALESAIKTESGAQLEVIRLQNHVTMMTAATSTTSQKPVSLVSPLSPVVTPTPAVVVPSPAPPVVVVTESAEVKLLKEVKKDIGSLATTLSSVNGKVDTASGDVKSLQTSVSTGFTGVNTAITAVNTSISTVNSSISTVNSSITAVNSRLTAIEQKLDTIKNDLLKCCYTENEAQKLAAVLKKTDKLLQSDKTTAVQREKILAELENIKNAPALKVEAGETRCRLQQVSRQYGNCVYTEYAYVPVYPVK